MFWRGKLTAKQVRKDAVRNAGTHETDRFYNHTVVLALGRRGTTCSWRTGPGTRPKLRWRLWLAACGLRLGAADLDLVALVIV